MGKSELLKRSLEMGTSFIDMTRERAEVFVKELVDAGVVRKGQAEKAIDLVVERSRKRTEALGAIIRQEVAEQLAAFGVATKDDIARLESKLHGGSTASNARESTVKSPSGGTKAAPIRKSAKTSRAPTSRQPIAPPAMKSQKRPGRAEGTPTPPGAR
ncbi:MAG TPA: hypothetical protein VM121_03900 [Acidimicrobiales bacterium]|nr:hypothetical protein [Acidimicrobiales bacterium]